MPAAGKLQESKQWHADRLKGLGGSDIAAALGVSPWKTQLELWGEKTRLAPSTFEGNEFTYWGKALEAVVADRFSRDNPDVKLESVNSAAHKDHPFMRANTDRIIFNKGGDTMLGVWEGKTASAEFSEVPVHYQLQVQHYMYVFDLPFAVISVLFHGNNYQEFRIERDPAYEADIVPQLVKFWSNVQSKLPVFEPVTMGDMKILMEHAGDEQPEGALEIHTDTEIEIRIRAIQALTEKAKEIKLDLSRNKAIVLKYLIDNGSKSLELNGRNVATLVSTPDRTIFNAESFKESEPDIYQKYLNKQRKGWVALRVASK